MLNSRLQNNNLGGAIPPTMRDMASFAELFGNPGSGGTFCAYTECGDFTWNCGC